MQKLLADEKPVDKRILPDAVHLSRGSVNGAIPTMKALGLIEQNGHRRFLRLTEMGQALARAIRRNDHNTIRNIGLEAVTRHRQLETAMRVLKANPGIPTIELAKVVAHECGKEWPKEKTYSHAGGAMKSILVGFLLVEGTRRRRAPPTARHSQTRFIGGMQSVPRPSVLPAIHELIVKLHRFHVFDSERLIRESGERDILIDAIDKLVDVVQDDAVRNRVNHLKHFVERAFETEDVEYLRDVGWMAQDLEAALRSENE